MKLSNVYKSQFIKYGLIGAFSASLDLAIFLILISFFLVDVLFANAFSIHFGILISFFLNSRLNFKKINKIYIRFLRFYTTAFLGFLLSHSFLYVGLNFTEISSEIIKIASFPFIFLMQFYINKKVTFKN